MTLEKMPFPTLETEQARRDGRYDKALRRLVKRREAISSANPFLTAIVATTRHWVYHNGAVCYVRRGELRILDIWNSADQEAVIDITQLLQAAIEGPVTCKFKFRPLYYANGIVSCLYMHPKAEKTSSENSRGERRAWLLVIKPAANTVLTVRRLEHSCNIFVRNNDRYLYYGTCSESRVDSLAVWELRGFNISTGEWLENKLQPPRFVGTEMGSALCFDIIGDHFYGLSSTTPIEDDGIECDSYYYYFRFPLDRPYLSYMEWPPNRRLWRRRHYEGIIDDRWSFIKIFRDETSGILKILEGRKEWLFGSGNPTRSYYTTWMRFDGETELDDSEEDECFGEEGPTVTHDFTSLTPRLDRSPENVHLGDDGSDMIMFTYLNCFLRSYHPSSQTFLDLVNDPSPSEPDGRRIRIRAGCRRLRIASERQRLLETNLTTSCADGGHQSRFHMTPKKRAEWVYKHDDVRVWPPDEPPGNDLQAESSMQKLHDILNPPGFTGNMRVAWDERSVVYATGNASPGTTSTAIVLISFDPSIYLRGTRPFFSSRPSSDFTDCEECETQAQTGVLESPGPMEEKKLAAMPSSWARRERAMYRTIGRGYHFAK
ncbi:hypothetical protein VTK73DRAFT_9715 [Phialemonium thermophilum]|uniref:F-box domain-containing protein n=1 Tax=Phialemonium thermophilum TaxID=223376 RepID=A0ABR3XIZ5_9PEZI